MNRISKRKTLYILVGLIFLLLLYLIIEFQSEKNFPHFEPWNCTNATESESMSIAKCHNYNTKTILFYTPWFSLKPWTEELDVSSCPEKKCNLTYNVYDIGKSVSCKELQQIQKYR